MGELTVMDEMRAVLLLPPLRPPGCNEVWLTMAVVQSRLAVCALLRSRYSDGNSSRHHVRALSADVVVVVVLLLRLDDQFIYRGL